MNEIISRLEALPPDLFVICVLGLLAPFVIPLVIWTMVSMFLEERRTKRAVREEHEAYRLELAAWDGHGLPPGPPPTRHSE